MQIRRFARLLSALFLAAFLMGCGGSAQDPTAPAVINKSPNDELTYAAVTLDNGLQVLMVSDQET